MRFSVEKEHNTFWIKDNHWQELLQSEKAVVLYFRSETNAKTVADILNREWSQFIRNPN